MNVEFDQPAKQWIQGKGGQLTVKTLNVLKMSGVGFLKSISAKLQ
ncbi:hypothetical protein [Paenibacillus oceani]|nr:hypothetical protein [Paenibacillus oceani]